MDGEAVPIVISPISLIANYETVRTIDYRTSVNAQATLRGGECPSRGMGLGVIRN
ncbi:hypothetical protein Dxin01_00026 [Deinococcus xinjiangensis]|uniref:Uncharacterized protein n=1 Tax=Deinococcus xinjiangensis TaxID=457454 RepID=A0ABP9V6J4_9DEIO